MVNAWAGRVENDAIGHTVRLCEATILKFQVYSKAIRCKNGVDRTILPSVDRIGFDPPVGTRSAKARDSSNRTRFSRCRIY